MLSLVNPNHSKTSVFVAAVASAAMIVALLWAGEPAAADTAPAPATPVTVSTDPLPTVQIDGIVWDQEIVGNTVYAVGSFANARPAGAAAGTNQTPRSNILAYDIRTGVLISSFAPTTNAQIRTVDASPDGTILYIGGDFTTVNGQARGRVAALQIPSGTLVSGFAPSANAAVRGIVATASTVYIAGSFGRVSSNDRPSAAAVSTAGALLPWAPVLAGGRGYAVEVSPDQSKVLVSGSFTTANGSSNPGYGLAAFNSTTAQLLPWAANDKVRNGGDDAAILSLRSDGNGSVYGTGYHFGAGGTLEGMFRANWADGAIIWVEDCHGDVYDVVPINDVVYEAGHTHYCGSIKGGFPQSDPWTFYRGLAFTQAQTGITPAGVNLGYPDWAGSPAPSLLHWFPTFNTGNVSGANQGPWTVNGTTKFVVYGGEFTRVNSTNQQGLVRFTVTQDAPNLDGPRLSGSNWVPQLVSIGAGRMRVSWPMNYDRDNEVLNYRVIRDGVNASPVYEVDAVSKSPDFGLGNMSFVDSALAAGSSHTYRLRAQDAKGNVAWSTIVSGTVSGTSVPSAYSDTITRDAPQHYWPLNDTGSSGFYDWAGASDLTRSSGVTQGVQGAVLGEGTTAARFDGTGAGYASTSTVINGPNTFGIEAWVRTSSNAGGKIVGFGNSATGNSSNYDRHVYMNPAGAVVFGVYPGSSQTIASSSGFNDGQWHHIVAGLSSAGMILYVDGKVVAQRSDVTTGQAYSGVWRIGGDSPWEGNGYLAGDIDEVALYAAPLTRQVVASHYVASGRTLEGQTPPADDYGAAVYDKEPTLYWRLGESSGTQANDASFNDSDGSAFGSYSWGSPGALSGVSNTAITMNGGQLVSKKAYSNPRDYSLEAWFKTNTTVGGKIIGFGNSPTGSSSSYDRHVYMQDDGRLVFGAYPNREVRLTSATPVNDNQWHQVTATQTSTGMSLYIDGVLVASNTEAGAQDYSGYWHVGADPTWGSSSPAFHGVIDEVAVYPSALSASDVSLHYSLGSTGQTPNTPPVAAFTASTQTLAVSVDASTSNDPDGTIAAYSWNWGDGTPAGNGAQATHTYGAGGTYTVTLTVTDNAGGTGTATQSVTVTAPPANVPPVARLAVTSSGLTASADGGGSSDSDGTIAAYSWNWGDGSPASSGVTASHPYAAAGSYTITLTVTDDDGAASTASSVVSVTAPAGPVVYARDDFARTAATGLGSAAVGGTWTLSTGASSYSVDASGAQFKHTTAGSLREAYLTSIAQTDTAATVDVILAARPVGASAYATVIARRVGTADYRGRLVVAPSGAVTLQLQQTTTTLGSATPALNVAAGDIVHLRVEATGVSPTTVRMKVWKNADPEPGAWALTRTDTTASLQAAGSVGLSSYLGGGATGLPFTTRFDNFWAGSTAPAAPPQNQAPVAAFSVAATGLSAAFDASASTDDNAIVAYAWNFGDGQTGSGSTPTHAYAAAGDYTVTLTVTDAEGKTGTATKVATVADVTPQPGLANDDFERAVASGLGSAPLGGAWTLSSSAASYSVANGAARFTAASAGNLRNAYLTGVSSVSTDLSVSVALPALPQVGSAYIAAMARRVGTSDYEARIVVSPTGSVQLQLRQTATTLSSANIAGLTVGAGEKVSIRVRVMGSSPTVVSGKVWKSSSAEPSAWQLNSTDATAALQAAGHVGLSAYASGSVANVPFVFDFDNFIAVAAE